MGTPRTPQESRLRLSGDRKTRTLWWQSRLPCRTVLLVHHGLGEHAGRFAALAALVSEAPVHVVAFDARGHGEEGSPRGDGGTLDSLAADLDGVIDQVRKLTGTEMVVLFGHSMGAAVLGHYLTSQTPDPSVVAAVFSAPPVAIHKTIPIRCKLSVAPLFANWIPRKTVRNSIPPSAISSVPREVDRYRSDPLIHSRVSFELGLSLIRDAERIPQRAQRILMPTLVYGGEEDPIVLRRGVDALFAGLGSEEKRLVIFPGARHETHHESSLVKEALKAVLVEFLGLVC